MPWSKVTEMNAKINFLSDYISKKYNITSLCKLHGISRKTGYKIIHRFNESGSTDLEARPRTPFYHPFTTDDKTKDFIIDIKKRYIHWGPKKIKQWLVHEYPDENWPAASTIGNILKDKGLVKPFQRKTRVSVYSKALAEITAPNDVWSADYKGQFRLGNKQYCYPLTITDNYSRYFLGCKIVPGTKFLETKEGFIEAFQRYGLPRVIRTDNGIPFASAGACGLSRLSLWFVKLDIIPERIPLGHPECNGRHERMHRTLKAETTKPPGRDSVEQQNKFNEFMKLYNDIRPHAALGGKRPKDVYTSSNRPYLGCINPPEYESDMKIYRGKNTGYINFANHSFYLGEIFEGEDIGFKEEDNDIWSLYFYKLRIACLNIREKTISAF